MTPPTTEARLLQLRDQLRANVARLEEEFTPETLESMTHEQRLIIVAELSQLQTLCRQTISDIANHVKVVD